MTIGSEIMKLLKFKKRFVSSLNCIICFGIYGIVVLIKCILKMSSDKSRALPTEPGHIVCGVTGLFKFLVSNF